MISSGIKALRKCSQFDFWKLKRVWNRIVLGVCAGLYLNIQREVLGANSGNFI